MVEAMKTNVRVTVVAGNLPNLRNSTKMKKYCLQHTKKGKHKIKIMHERINYVKT